MTQPISLIIAMQNGSESAFAELYEMYSKALFGIIVVIVKDENLAQEVLQDVFVKVWSNSASYDIDKGRFYTWLLNIARNKAIDVTRSKAFKNANKNLSKDNFVDIIGSHDNLDRQSDTIGLKKFVAALQPMCAQLIDLLYFKGFTQAETAETTNTPLGTIKTRARNCLKELRKIMSEN